MGFEATLEAARTIRSAQRMLGADASTLRARQRERFLRVFAAACDTQPYQQLYDAQLRSQEPDRWDSLPFLERDWIARFPLKERLSGRAGAVITFTTSGTTGKPMVMGWSRGEERTQAIVRARQWRAQGALYGAQPFVIDFRSHPRFVEVEGARGPFDVSVLASPEEIAEEIRKSRPKTIVGIPSLILEVGLALKRYPLLGLVTYGEVLDHHTRVALQESFGTDPFDMYASAECGSISWECPSRHGYHVNADVVGVEIVDETGQPVPSGTTGEVVVTNLWNATCPMLRYRTADRSRLVEDRCDCGITLPLMGPVEGRTNDWIVSRDGTSVSPIRFLLNRIPGWDPGQIRRYRVVQTTPDDFVIEVEWRREPSDGFTDVVSAYYELVLNRPVNVTIEGVAAISRPRSEKFRVIESRVPKDAHTAHRGS